MKLGSLFDGSGGFPLAGSLCGIEPVWAAEVEPYPIAVTRSRFPNMRHLGDISKVNGAEIEPVDIITFGSPCQDLSVAGKRAGLKHEANGDEETTRSGLFMEAVRIIKEMRKATGGQFPRFALWENVPGAFSSNKGEDFRVVIDELVRIAEPGAVVPPVPKAGWAYADSYTGDGWSLAYRVFDAQYWGVPQRRRRIHLVVDFTDGAGARKVLFERPGVRGYFAAGRTPWQGAAGDAEDRLRTDDQKGEGFDGYNGDLTGAVSATLGVNCGVSTGRNGVIQRGRQLDAVAYGVTAKGNGEAFISRERHPSLTAGGGLPGQSYPAAMVPICMATQQGGAEIREDDKAPTITAAAGMSGNNQPVVCYPPPHAVAFHLTQDPIPNEEVFPCLSSGNPDHGQAVAGIAYQAAKITDTHILDDQGGSVINVRTDGQSPTLRAQMGGHPPVVMQPATVYAVDQGGGKSGANVHENKAPTLYTTHGGEPAVAYEEDPTHIVRRLTPTECARLQGFADRWGDIDKKDSFTDEEYAFWCDVYLTKLLIDGTVVYNDDGELVYAKRRTLFKHKTKAQMLTWYNKLHTDSAKYKMWGNGIALPPALYCMQGIVDAMNKQEDDSWLM